MRILFHCKQATTPRQLTRALTSVVVTYTVTDQCNRTATCTQTFTIQPPLPTITCPAGQTVQCIADIQPLVNAQITAFSTAGVTSACGFSFTVTSNYTPPTDPCATSVVVTYTVTDQCNRTATCTTDIHYPTAAANYYLPGWSNSFSA